MSKVSHPSNSSSLYSHSSSGSAYVDEARGTTEVSEITRVTMKDDARWFSNALLASKDRIELPAELLESLNKPSAPPKAQEKPQPGAVEQAKDIANYAMQSPFAHRLMAQCQEAALEFSKSKRT